MSRVLDNLPEGAEQPEIFNMRYGQQCGYLLIKLIGEPATQIGIAVLF